MSNVYTRTTINSIEDISKISSILQSIKFSKYHIKYTDSTLNVECLIHIKDNNETNIGSVVKIEEYGTYENDILVKTGIMLEVETYKQVMTNKEPIIKTKKFTYRCQLVPSKVFLEDIIEIDS